MKIISTKTEPVTFSRVIEGNQSETLCTIPFAIHTVESEGFTADGFVSFEFRPSVTYRVVCVDSRYFKVSITESGSGKHYRSWLSVTLPPGMDPRPQPREWDAKVSTCGSTGKQYLWDTRTVGLGHHDEIIRVREILD